MFSSIHHCLLLADRSMLRDLGSGLRDRREHFQMADLLPWLLVIAAVAALLLIISRFVTRNDSQRLFNNSQGLFRTLCDAHLLDRSEQRLLTQIAKAEGVSPAMLFLIPTAFTRIDRIAEFARPEAAEALAAKLFGDAMPGTGLAPLANDLPCLAESARTLPIQTAAPMAENSSAEILQPDAAASGALESHDRREAPRSAPSLFQPAPPTIVPALDARGEDAVGPARRLSRSDESSASITEQQATRALEILMQQIKAERGAESPDPVQQANPKLSHGYRADEALWQPPPSVAAGGLASTPV